MDCRKPIAIEFRTKLEFNLDDLIMIKEQSALKKIIKSISSEKILLQHSVLNYRIDLYFLQHKLPAEIHEKGHKSKDEHKEVERENAIKEHLGCKFIRFNSDKKDYETSTEVS